MMADETTVAGGEVAPEVVAPIPVVDAPVEQAAETIETIDVTPTETLDPALPDDDGFIDVEAAANAEEGGESSGDESEEPNSDESEGETAETIEFDFGGTKLEVLKDSLPPELAGRVQEFASGIWSDYTGKSQANADMAKGLEARSSALDNLTQLNGDVLTTYTRGMQIQSEIAQLRQVDTNALWNSQDPDPAVRQEQSDRARRVSDLLSQKQSEFDNVVAQVGEYETRLNSAQAEESVRVAEKGKAVLDGRIKNFSSEKAPEVVKYAIASGMDKATAEEWSHNPRVTEWAYKAMLYDRMATKRKQVSRKSTSAVAQPVTQMKSAGNAGVVSNDPEKMSMGQLSKHLGLHPDS